MAKKRLGGLKNIHFAKLVGGEFQAPTKISGAKKIECALDFEGVEFFSDDVIDFSDYIFAGGEGTLTVSGLTPCEHALLFGNTVSKGGVSVKSTDTSSEGAFLFERGKLGSNAKRLYVIYACKCAPVDIGGETKEGKLNEETVEIKFSVRELDTNDIYYFIDTDADDVDQSKVTAWYNTVQKPTEQAVLANQVEGRKGAK